MSGNYPPGVTGSEFEITGPDREWEDLRNCGACVDSWNEESDEPATRIDEAETVWELWSHRDIGVMGMCTVCGHEEDLTAEFDERI